MTPEKTAISIIDRTLLAFVPHQTVTYYTDGELDEVFPENKFFYPAGWYLMVEGIGAYPVKVSTEVPESGTFSKEKETKGLPVIVCDLRSDNIIQFDPFTDPEYAVRYCYVTEDAKHLASWFFNAIHDREQEEIALKLPVTKAQTCVACGDWVTARLDD